MVKSPVVVWGMNIRRRSLAALRTGAREANPNATYDSAGYTAKWENNLGPGLPLTTIVGDMAAGAGRELDVKLRAAHSSAALAINTFGPYREDPGQLHICHSTGSRSVRFEGTCPTGLGGTPPHLDLLAEGDSIVAVEAKCTEWMKCRLADFAPSYDQLQTAHGSSPWFAQIESLRARPDLYEFLDVAQLIKHALGLEACFGGKVVQLLYLYWEPSNTSEWPECQRHRTETETLTAAVRGAGVELVAMSYGELLNEWERQPEPPRHLPYLRLRYDRPA